MILRVVWYTKNNEMNTLNAKVHGYLDYITVLIFVLAPSALGLAGVAAFVAYALAAVHALMTLLTKFPLGAVSLIPLWLHGWVERVVGPVLVIASFFPIIAVTPVGQIFYLVMGIIIALIGVISDYKSL